MAGTEYPRVPDLSPRSIPPDEVSTWRMTEIWEIWGTYGRRINKISPWEWQANEYREVGMARVCPARHGECCC